MRKKRCKVDSLNLSDKHLESIFLYNEDYSIQTVKSKVEFEPLEWSKTFGKSLTQNIIEAKIVHSHLGLTLPLKTFSSSSLSQTLEFAGLHGYNERSKLLVQTLNELKSQLQHTKVTRMDIAIDYKGEIPKRIIRVLSKTREPFEWYNTIYWKTPKEKKTNQRMDIKIYDKALHVGLDYPLARLEFVFKGSYFHELHFRDLDLAIKKMEKSIKKASGLSVKIDDLFLSRTHA